MNSTFEVIELNRRIESLCVKVESGDADLVAELCTSWRVHETLDRNIVYPQISHTRRDAEVLIARAMADHRLIDRLVEKVDDGAREGEDSARRHGLLARLIRDHVVGEERRVLPLLPGNPRDPIRFATDTRGYRSGYLSPLERRPARERAESSGE